MRIGMIASMLVLAFAVSGCVGTHTIPFSDADFSAYVGNGPATVDGAAVGRTQGGEAKTCAGYPVYLAPATAYDAEGISNLNMMAAVNLAAGPAIKYWRQSACDAEGRFSFDQVPDGSWYVITSIKYQVYAPTLGNVQATESQGGLLVKKIALHRGKNHVILTSQDIQTGLPF